MLHWGINRDNPSQPEGLVSHCGIAKASSLEGWDWYSLLGQKHPVYGQVVLLMVGSDASSSASQTSEGCFETAETSVPFLLLKTRLGKAC